MFRSAVTQLTIELERLKSVWS